ncbi:PREDICTED: probable 28S ribosomal protein S25, mitochondrial [Priapulus caudatus]|uniref:Small ribosomal subunit protein mS25 n=1 Tax=Priapulus caudatus TaxID=37621 RepID=A0ABM1E6S7_PRICU|nr:PREDICTED: probable 28S ribosomal protein S25, mitochondrial [Priapulus caudatus]
MPFMKGPAPIRRTLKYLNAGRIHFREQVKVVTVNYLTHGAPGKGARDFVFWHLPQMQYKNPDVQILTLQNMTPTPFIRAWLESGEDVILDVDCKSKDEIFNQVLRILGKTEEKLAEEARQAEKRDNPANFGFGCPKHCMCEVPGQVPCPSIVKLPNEMRAKHRGRKHKDDPAGGYARLW